MLVVPDASVILKWVLPRAEEPNWGQARVILEAFVSGEIELAVPSLWFFEVGNTLARRLGRRPGGQLLEGLLDLEIPVVPPETGWWSGAVSLVEDHGVTFYDAAYLAVARKVEGTLVTADAVFLRRIGSPADAVPLEGFSLED